jgi:hypothetical protein
MGSGILMVGLSGPGHHDACCPPRPVCCEPRVTCCKPRLLTCHIFRGRLFALRCCPPVGRAKVSRQQMARPRRNRDRRPPPRR